uniref:Uncharacterized protein n=1 Tax=Anguilla anguilla TaxID=7936 RepID=A0A0E9R6E9_ANGAN
MSPHLTNGDKINKILN